MNLLDEIAYKIYSEFEIKEHNKNIEEHQLNGCICGFYTIEDFIILDKSYMDTKEFYKKARKELRKIKLNNII